MYTENQPTSNNGYVRPLLVTHIPGMGSQMNINNINNSYPNTPQAMSVHNYLCSIQVDETVKGFRITYSTNNTTIWNEKDYSVMQNEYNGFNP